MKPGRYAAPDGSFARSAGGAGARGLALLALALIIGVVLLNATDADPPGTNVSTKGSGSTATGDDNGSSGKASGTTTTTVAPTTTQPAHAPKDVKAIVANASAVKGAAAGGRNALLAAQYNVLAPANSAAVPDSSVYFTPGYDRDALAIAGVLQLPGTTVKPLPSPAPFDTKGANVVIVLGADAAPRFAVPAATTAPAAGATTTTAKPAAGATTTTAKAAVTTTTAAATTTTKKP